MVIAEYIRQNVIFLCKSFLFVKVNFNAKVIFYPFQLSVAFHTEISHLTGIANPMTDVFMKQTLGRNELHFSDIYCIFCRC